MTTTVDETTFAKTPGKQRRMWLAKVLDSVDGTAHGIANNGDRERYQARVAFESAYSELWEADAIRFAETTADVEAAKTESHHSVAVTEAWHRRALKRPALLAGKKQSLLEPFGEHDRMPLDDYCTVGSTHESPVTAMRAIVPAARLEFVALQAGSPDGTAENVPAENRKWFEEAMEFQKQAYAEDLESVCRHYGSATGLPADIPDANHAAASCYWRRWRTRNSSRCELQTELWKIDAAEAAAKEPPRAFAESWAPRVGKNRRALISASFGDSPGGLRKAGARTKYEQGVAALEEDVAALLARDTDQLSEWMGSHHEAFARREAEDGEALSRPAVLRANAETALASPFKERWPFLQNWFDPADVKSDPLPMVATVPAARAKYTALVWGAKDEAPEGVAEEDRAAYDEAIELENQKAQAWLADVCRHYGGSTPDKIPDENKPAASLYWTVGQRMFALQCALELEVTRVKLEEQAARESLEMFG